jgi:outer membrane protein TolC
VEVEEPPAEPEVFSLAEAVRFALANSPRLRAARAAIQRAQGQEQAAFAPFLPQVDLVSRYGASSANLGPGAPGITGAILPSTLSAAHTFAQAEFELQWTLYDFGRTAGRYQQALARERLTKLQLLRAQETVAFDVTAAYLQGLLTAAVRVIQEEAIRRAEATLKDTRSRRAAGVADRDDVLRAEVQLSEAREALVVAEEAELAALARLNTVMGRNAGLPLRLVDRQTQPEFAWGLVQCLEIAADRRPEVAMAREAVAVAQHGRQVAAADFRPRVYVLGTVGYVNGANVEGGFQEGAGIHLNQPLYTGGRRQGDLRAADAAVAETVAQAQSLLDNISLEVTLAYRSVVAARKRTDLARPAVEEARENLRLVRSKYRNGNATPTDIVDAETALTRAQQRFSSATYEYLAALARLDYALGNPQGTTLDAAGAAEPPEELPPPRPLPGEA